MSKKVSNNNSNLNSDDDKKKLVPFSQKIKNKIRINVGGICSYCKKYTSVGDVMHIVVLDKKSSRSVKNYCDDLKLKENMFLGKNAIWICKACHDELQKCSPKNKIDELNFNKSQIEKDWAKTIWKVLHNEFDYEQAEIKYKYGFCNNYELHRMIMLYLLWDLNFSYLKGLSDFIKLIVSNNPYTFNEFDDKAKNIHNYLMNLKYYIECEIFVKFLNPFSEEITMKLKEYMDYIPELPNYLSIKTSINNNMDDWDKLECCKIDLGGIIKNKDEICKLQEELKKFFMTKYKNLLD